MLHQRWMSISGLLIFCLAATNWIASGSPHRGSAKGEAEIAGTNWTQFAEFINGTSSEELIRMNFSRILWDMEKSQSSGRRHIIDGLLGALGDLITQGVTSVGTSIVSPVACTACKYSVDIIKYYLRNGASEEDLRNMIYDACVKLEIRKGEACHGIVSLVAHDLIYFLKHMNVGSLRICSVFMSDTCDDSNNPNHEWEVALTPLNKPPIQPPIPPKESDTNYDPYDQEGSNTLFDLNDYKNYHKSSPVRPNCDDECRERLLYDLCSGRSYDKKALCQSLESRIDGET